MNRDVDYIAEDLTYDSMECNFTSVSYGDIPSIYSCTLFNSILVKAPVFFNFIFPKKVQPAKEKNKAFTNYEIGVGSMWSKEKPVDGSLLTTLSHIPAVFRLNAHFEGSFGGVNFNSHKQSRFIAIEEQAAVEALKQDGLSHFYKVKFITERNCYIFVFDVCEKASYDFCLKTWVHQVIDTMRAEFTRQAQNTPKAIVFVGYENRTPSKKKKANSQKVKHQAITQADIDKLVLDAASILKYRSDRSRKVAISGMILVQSASKQDGGCDLTDAERLKYEPPALFSLLDHSLALSSLPFKLAYKAQSFHLFLRFKEEIFNIYKALKFSQLQIYSDISFSCFPQEIIDILIHYVFLVHGNLILRTILV